MNQEPRWWQSSVDEILIGAFIAAVVIVAVIYLGAEAKEGITSGITALGVYLGVKTKSKAAPQESQAPPPAEGEEDDGQQHLLKPSSFFG